MLRKNSSFPTLTNFAASAPMTEPQECALREALFARNHSPEGHPESVLPENLAAISGLSLTASPSSRLFYSW